ncbi:MAG TPA: DUF5320 domain-containing protein [Firmicutes bacterium]|nr:DUF5320 domain-containing protein [Bacillota bacterium]
MPWGDRTGPLGLGPMTGRAAGYCAGFPLPGFAHGWPGAGLGRGGGWRFFWRRARLWGSVPYPWPPYAWGFGYLPGDPEYDEKKALTAWKGALQKQLEAIDKRLGELESK